jgi:ATP/maltotriose-dependent transcriptional regulator MalT
MSPPEGHPRLARALWAGAYVRFYAGDFGGAYEQSTRALEEARAADDLWCQARCLHILGTSMLLSDAGASRATVCEAYDLSLATGDRWCEADSLQMRAYTHIVQGDPEAAEELLERAKTLTNELDNDFQRAWYFIGVGYIAALRGKFDAARAYFEQGVGLARSVGDPTTELWGCGGWLYQELAAGRLDAVQRIVASVAEQHRDWGALGDALIPGLVATAEITTSPEQASRTLIDFGQALVAGGDLIDGGQFLTIGALAAIEADDLDTAERAAEAAVGAATNASMFHAPARLAWAAAARARGDVGKAEQLAHEALAFLAEGGTCIDAAGALEALGGLALDAGSAAEGLRLLAAGDALRSRIGQRRLPAGQARFEADVKAAATVLEQAFDDAWTAGAALSWEEAAAYAQRARGERRRPTFGWDSLTPTELEVVRLAAEGLTNPQIGERLFIGRGTVKTHLAHVYAKLGVANRSELATQAARRSLEPR